MGRDPYREIRFDQAALVGVVWYSTRQPDNRNTQVCVIQFIRHQMETKARFLPVYCLLMTRRKPSTVSKRRKRHLQGQKLKYWLKTPRFRLDALFTTCWWLWKSHQQPERGEKGTFTVPNTNVTHKKRILPETPFTDCWWLWVTHQQSVSSGKGPGRTKKKKTG